MTLLETRNSKMNYISGNHMVDFILEIVKALEKPPIKIGLLVEENMSESNISYMLSTGISQDNIPIKDAKPIKFVQNKKVFK